MFPNNWKLLAKVTINKTAVSGTPSNIPIILKEGNFPDVVFNNVDDGGGDLRITSDRAGVARLAIEIITFDTVSKKVEMYVKVPALSSAKDRHSTKDLAEPGYRLQNRPPPSPVNFGSGAK